MNDEFVYSFGLKNLLAEIVLPQPELAPLAAIQAKLAEAAALADTRRYQPAIAAYESAQAMILGHLMAKKPPAAGFRYDLPLNPALFEPLLSASAEWLNLLPVGQPAPTVRPRVDVNQSALGQVAESAATGLFSQALSSPAAVEASADVQLAAQLQASGNASAAEFFVNRAQARDRTMSDRFSEVAATRTTRAGVDTVGIRAIGVAAQPHLRTAEAAGAVALQAQQVTESTRIPLPPEVTNQSRTFATMIAGNVETFDWAAGSAPPLAQIRRKLYEARALFEKLDDLIIPPSSAADIALQLPHCYYYVIPLGLAECYRSLGDFERAESHYLGASRYQYLNAAIEAPFLWTRLAQNYVLWANSLYLADEVPLARGLYERVYRTDASAPADGLYSDRLKAGATAARTVISNIDALLAGTSDATALAVSPDIVAVVLEAYEQVTKIDAGLDFWGQSAATVPIWTFEYLQSAAVNFAQLAIGAERDFIQFQERSDQGALTRQQLQQGVVLARAEAATAKQQTKAAEAEAQAYEAAVQASEARAENAWENAEDCGRSSTQAMRYRTLANQMGGGPSTGDVNTYADYMMGRPQTEGHRRFRNGRLTGDPELFGAAFNLVAERLGKEFEVRSLERQAEEMELAAEQAHGQLKASQARAKAARAAEAAAAARETGARRTLEAFKAQYFTPEVWGRMAATMGSLSRRYLHMAIRTARLMQRAYNFETDQDLDVIKLDYGAGQVKGLLAADLLLADIQSFTFDLITQTRSKPQPLRQTISLATRHAYAFEHQLRRTGVMEFQTLLEDFDEAYPGIYGGRIEAVEVKVDGIVPPVGISGALTNDGVSQYRMPSADAAGRHLKTRVQSRETLILSDYDVRAAALVNPDDRRMTRIFQGAGLASTWRLELLPLLNDVNYETLIDVRLTFHYRARFEPQLREQVLADLASRPGVNHRKLGIPLRWLFPDVFFAFFETGRLEIPIDLAMFPVNQLDPKLTSVALVLVTTPRERVEGVVLRVAAPGQVPISAATNDEGVVDPGDLNGIAGGAVVGPWLIELRAADNSSWVQNRRLELGAIQNVALVLGYSFTPRQGVA